MAIGYRSRKNPETRPPAQPNRSLAGGLDCLGTLVAAERPVGSRELARELGLDPTRVNRLLGTLAHLGLAERTAGRKYVPGPGLHVLAAMSLRGSRLLSAAMPHLAALGAELPGYSVALGVLWRRHVAYLYFAGPGEEPQVAIASRDLFPAEKSSIGLVMLAGRERKEVRELFKDRPAAEGKELLGRVQSTRKRGWALVAGRTLGVPVGDPPVAGLALAGKVNARNRARLVRKLTQAARDIAREMNT